MMDVLGSALEPLSFPFMQRALVGCVLVGLICAVLGVFVVLQHLSFVGHGLAQGALPGLAIGYVAGWNLPASGLATAVLLALGVGYLREHARVGADTALALAFSAATALGVALVSAVRFGPVDVNSFLFGNVLGIGESDLVVLAIAAVVLGALFVAIYRQLVFAAFDPDGAAAAGVPVRRLRYLFLVMVAVAVVVSLQTVGLLLVTALLVIPAAIARQWADRLPGTMALAALAGAASAVVGRFVSYFVLLPSGATIVLAATIVFGVSLAARAVRDARAVAPQAAESG